LASTFKALAVSRYVTTTLARQAGCHQGLQAHTASPNITESPAAGLADVRSRSSAMRMFRGPASAQVLPHAVAADDDVLVDADGLQRNGGHLQRCSHSLLTSFMTMVCCCA
jgi:hypothetical protein